MDVEIRTEFEKVHERITRVRERVVNLEAQQPHMVASLGRIEKMVDRLNGHLTKAIWIIVALFIGALFKIVSGGV